MYFENINFEISDCLAGAVPWLSDWSASTESERADGASLLRSLLHPRRENWCLLSESEGSACCRVLRPGRMNQSAWTAVAWWLPAAQQNPLQLPCTWLSHRRSAHQSAGFALRRSTTRSNHHARLIRCRSHCVMSRLSQGHDSKELGT